MDEEHLNIRDPFTLSGPVGRRGGNVREDVGKIESLLRLAGVHDLDPTDGPTGYFGVRLEEAVKAFQKGHGLRTDGEITPGGETLKALARILQSMGRHGDTVLAHLTPGEAQFLHEITDGGSLNPMTGLVEFYYSNDGRSDYGELESMEALGGSGSDVDSGPESGGKREGGHPGWGMAPIGPTPPSPPSSSNRNDREGGHPGWGMAPSGPTPPAPSAASERTYDDEITRRDRLNAIEARRRERNKPNLLEDNDAQPGSGLWNSADDQALEHDDQALNFVDLEQGPSQKETQEPVNSKRQIMNIRKEEEKRKKAKHYDDAILRQMRMRRIAEQFKGVTLKTKQEPSQYGGKRTYTTKGPITIRHGTTTGGVDGLQFYAKWHALDRNGRRMFYWEKPGNKGQDITSAAVIGWPKDHFISPPYENPHGWEVDVSIPPQPTYNGNAGTSWVDVIVTR